MLTLIIHNNHIADWVAAFIQLNSVFGNEDGSVLVRHRCEGCLVGNILVLDILEKGA